MFCFQTVVLFYVQGHILTLRISRCSAVSDPMERHHHHHHHHHQSETDDEGIERDAGECDDEPSSSHHITLTQIMEVSPN